ncbi:MAG TPA: signal peptidase I [Bryobacteraceae bacterium]|jgi:signal peptidase I|nr:signal peptidase I [Bryobacteraceae bacterium]
MEELTNQGPDAAESAQNVSERPAASATLAWLRDLSLSVLIAIIVILFLYQPVKVEGTSMMPSLIDQERIFINKFIYRFGLADVGRGDTVVFWFPGDPTKSYIKRVIGVPGDTIEVNDGTVIVNGKPLEEDYVPPDYRDHVSMPRRVVPPDQYFVLGDHRVSSNDSRNWGMVPRRYIYGKAVFVYWPLDRIGVLH